MPYLEVYKKAKEEKNISSATIAMLSSASLPTVQRFFQGTGKRPSVDIAASIANVLGVSLDEAFGVGEPKQKPLDANVEAIISSYTELIKEKDERLKEQTDRILELDETIKQMRVDKIKRQRNNFMLIVFVCMVAILNIFVLFFSLTH
jgi:transcriptional regulator with XRE-family HTH domain